MNATAARSGSIDSAPRRHTVRVANLCRVLWNGGVQRAAIAQTQALRALGFECDLIFLRAVPGTSYELPSGTRVLETDPSNPRGVGRAFSRALTRLFAQHRGVEASVDLDLLWASRRTLRHYSVVIYNDQYAGLLGAYLRLRRGQAYVQMFHEFYPSESMGVGARVLRPAAELLDRVSILLAPAIVTTSTRVLARIDRFAPGRSFLARLGAPDLGGPEGVGPRDRRSVFSVTVWDRGRHPELYLDLARALPRFRFVVAGIWADPDHLEEFRRMASALPNLVVTGPVSEERRRRLLHESYLYLRIGYNESGPGMGGLEALSAGSIVIANTGLGLSEILTDGVDGFILPGATAGEVIGLLNRIDSLAGPELERMSAAAQDLARRNNWNAHGRVLAEAIHRATADPAAPDAELHRPEPVRPLTDPVEPP